MSKLPAGWYILLYHDVSWEEGPFIRHVGGTCAPDVFRDHVRACRELGEIVAVREGFSRLQAGRIDEPVFSFWFDDGLAGVRKYAAPILERYSATGAVSICSRFAERRELFWRFKLSYLHSIDAGRLVRSRLRARGYVVDGPLRALSRERFDSGIIEIIDAVFDEAVTESVHKDAFRGFETGEGVRDLQDRGWTVANHSAAHYPIGEPHVMDIVLEQFDECESYLQTLTGRASDFWVFPFDIKLTGEAVDLVRRERSDKAVVLVRNRPNTAGDPCILTRIQAPVSDRRRLGDVLTAAARRGAR
jgi:peptidoglycan/xylan/chitin deacetylase (PgdA/CDA1 family)